MRTRTQAPSLLTMPCVSDIRCAARNTIVLSHTSLDHENIPPKIDNVTRDLYPSSTFCPKFFGHSLSASICPSVLSSFLPDAFSCLLSFDGHPFCSKDQNNVKYTQEKFYFIWSGSQSLLPFLDFLFQSLHRPSQEPGSCHKILGQTRHRPDGNPHL
jgi:hypothetical protein